MGRRNLRPTLGAGTNMTSNVMLMSNILAYADGSNDVLDIAEKLNIPMFEMFENIEILVKEGLLKGLA